MDEIDDGYFILCAGVDIWQGKNKVKPQWMLINPVWQANRGGTRVGNRRHLEIGDPDVA